MNQQYRSTSPATERPGGAVLSAVGPRSNVLVRGTSLCGKRPLALGVMAALSADERPVVLSATVEAETLHRQLIAEGNEKLSDRWYVVDAVRPRVTGGPIACPDGGDRRTWYVRSPSDLTGLGMSTNEALSAVVDGGNRPRLFVDSLSTLLQYNSLDRVYRFLHVLNGRVTAAGGVTIQVIHSDAHDSQTVATLAHLFDTVIDVTAGDDGEQVILRDDDATESISLPLAEILSTLPTVGSSPGALSPTE